MTTVLLTTPYFPPHPGGVEQYVANLGRMLATRHGDRVVVATTAAPERPAGGRAEENGLTVYRLPVHARVSNTPLGAGWTRALRRIVHAERVELVNAHGPVPVFADVSRRAAGRLPFVLTYHAGRMRTGRRLPDLVCAAYESTLLAATARRADELISASDHVVAELPGLFAGRATTIEPGADTDLFRPGPPVPEPRILFAASLAPATRYKGLDDLLRTVRELVPAVPGIHLEVAGSGSAEPHYRALAAELGIAGRVTFAGFLAGADLAAAYRRARLLCLPTRFDNFPTVIVEAMASGRPVVATRVGAIPDLVTPETGRLVPPGDGAALAGALTAVLTDDALAARLGAAGRARVERDLSWQRQSDRTAEVFRRTLAMAGARS